MRFEHLCVFAASVIWATAPLMAQTTGKTTSSSTAKKSSTATSPVRKPAATGPTTDDEKAIYAIGLSMYGSLSQFNLSPAEVELVKRAISDAAAGKPAVDLKIWGPKIDPLLRARTTKMSADYLTKAAAEPGAIKTPSGLIYREMKPGTGASPTASDTVEVNYRGTFINGKEFDSSYSRNEPAKFPLGNVIRCWTEGVQKMKVGGKARLVCPSDIAYGDQGRPGIPGGSTLIFEIELLSIGGK
jgi:FKBP-type peptidyl-prolyl cis-trans isomerase FkpA